MFRRKEEKNRVNSRFIKGGDKTMVKRRGGISVRRKIDRSKMNRGSRRSSMLVRDWRDKRRVIGKRRRKREGSEERTKFVRTRSSKKRVVERNSNTVSITRSVDIGVVAVMWNELMKISKGNANEKVERSIHNKKVKREV